MKMSIKRKLRQFFEMSKMDRMHMVLGFVIMGGVSLLVSLLIGMLATYVIGFDTHQYSDTVSVSLTLSIGAAVVAAIIGSSRLFVSKVVPAVRRWAYTD